MGWAVTCFLNSHLVLPSGESQSQVVNLSNLISMEVEETPVGSDLLSAASSSQTEVS